MYGNRSRDDMHIGLFPVTQYTFR